jgi:hypothetical protein
MLGILLVALLLIGQFHPGTGAEVLGWKPTRSAELQARNEIDDAEQMLAAAPGPSSRAAPRSTRRPATTPSGAEPCASSWSAAAAADCA